MKLINDKEFLKELGIDDSPHGKIFVHDVKCGMPGKILEALSKHLKDLPKKQEHPRKGYDLKVNYKQECSGDCEKPK